MRKFVFFLATLGLMSLMAMAQAGAVDYPASTGPLTVSGTTVDAGGTVTVGGGGCAPGASTQITMELQVLTTVVADGAGSFSTAVTIPSATAPGAHTLVATCAGPNGGTVQLSSAITVAGSPLSALAFTGSNAGPLAGIAIAVIGVGILFVGVTRRRSMTDA